MPDKVPEELKNMFENFAKDFNLKGRGDNFISNKTPWQNGNGSIVGQQHELEDVSKEDISKPRNMPATRFPNVTALFFTALCTRVKSIVEIKITTVKMKMGIAFKTKDGLFIIYRPTGGASNKTPTDMATVELDFEDYVGGGHPNLSRLKFKFPKKQRGDEGERFHAENKDNLLEFLTKRFKDYGVAFEEGHILKTSEKFSNVKPVTFD